MDAVDPHVLIHQDRDVTRVDLLDRHLLTSAIVHEVGQQLGRVIEKVPHPKVLIDFQNVEYLCSAALGTLIAVNNKIRARQGQLWLSNVAPRVRQVFVKTRLDSLFQIENHADQAAANPDRS